MEKLNHVNLIELKLYIYIYITLKFKLLYKKKLKNSLVTESFDKNKRFEETDNILF